MSATKANWIYRLLSKFVIPTLFFLFNVRIENKERLNNWKSGIIATNHISYFDPPLIGGCLRHKVHFLAKKELFAIPVLGFIIRKLYAIPIRRGVIDRKALENVSQLLTDGENVLIFPEGSRKNFTAKPGIGMIAIKTGVPVLPILVENTDKSWQCLFRRKEMRVIVGEVIPAISDYSETKDDFRRYAENVLTTIKMLANENSTR